MLEEFLGILLGLTVHAILEHDAPWQSPAQVADKRVRQHRGVAFEGRLAAAGLLDDVFHVCGAPHARTSLILHQPAKESGKEAAALDAKALKREHSGLLDASSAWATLCSVPQLF